MRASEREGESFRASLAKHCQQAGSQGADKEGGHPSAAVPGALARNCTGSSAARTRSITLIWNTAVLAVA